MVLTDQDLSSVTEKVKPASSTNGKKWEPKTLYELPLPAQNAVLFGVTGSPLDSKPFSIVKAGSDKSRKKLDCPGIAHAGAYPLELVVVQKEDGVHIQMVDAMFRMKLYFEDAGKWSFMKNMTMPGSIADEIKSKLKAAF